MHIAYNAVNINTKENQHKKTRNIVLSLDSEDSLSPKLTIFKTKTQKVVVLKT